VSDEIRITALEAALRDAVRLRIEAEVKLEVAQAEQFSALESVKRTKTMSRVLVELWYACRKDSTKKLSSTEIGRNLDFITNGLLDLAEDEILASIGVKTDTYSAQRELEARIAAWRTVTR
jgi:hypothetical protein